mgnify:CR=1 FL=1
MKRSDLVQIGFPNSITKQKIATVLENKYPGFELDKMFITKGRYSEQRKFERAIESIFPVST